MSDDISGRQNVADNSNENDETATCVRLYAEYRATFDAMPIDRLAPYRWQNLPKPPSYEWLPYAEMLNEFAAELANAINALAYHVRRIRAWAKVIASLTDDEKLVAVTEFIDVLGTAALTLPYSIKSRYAYAAAHLCHQANRAKLLSGWKDEFPSKQGRPLNLDDEKRGVSLYLNDIEPICSNWSSFRRFKIKVEAIGGESFKIGSNDFRNAYNHRFSPHFVIGMSRLVSRIKNAEGSVSYSLGGTEALDLTTIASLLQKEHDLCLSAFEAFQALVREHEQAIADFESNGRPS